MAQSNRTYPLPPLAFLPDAQEIRWKIENQLPDDKTPGWTIENQLPTYHPLHTLKER
ncbi:MAG: hypothetical protein LBU37_03330 [Tannerellaceae bacterium]|jgi:hypothetical protein|nr:hypothetical protein [Tannerellaceae bacterium]